VKVRIIQRAFPRWLAQQRGWTLRDKEWVTKTE
jgi:hypothetical protein